MQQQLINQQQQQTPGLLNPGISIQQQQQLLNNSQLGNTGTNKRRFVHEVESLKKIESISLMFNLFTLSLDTVKKIYKSL